jgi:hypothetical protein
MTHHPRQHDLDRQVKRLKQRAVITGRVLLEVGSVGDSLSQPDAGDEQMRKFLLAGAAIALAGSMARAQNAPGAPSEQPGQSSGRGPMMMRGMMGDDDEMSGRGRGERDDDEMSGRERGERRMMMRTTAAIFRIRRGDTSIFIKCADNESTQACVAAAGMLLDKFNPQTPRP